MRFLFLTVLLVGSETVSAQTIASLVRKEDGLKVDPTILQIVESRTSFPDSKPEKRQSTYDYYSNGLLKSREDYVPEWDRKTRVRFYYDSAETLISRSIENQIQVDRYQKDSIHYFYVGALLKSIVSYNRHGKVTSFATVASDPEGHPVELSSFRPDSVLIGKEKAQYDVSNNKAFLLTYNGEGIQVGGRREIVLDLEKEKERLNTDRKYDSHNQLIEYKEKACFSCIETVVFQVEYKYDNKGNWIQEDIYQVGDRRVKKSSVKRKIKYRT